jgi:HlyD family secretion protein
VKKRVLVLFVLALAVAGAFLGSRYFGTKEDKGLVLSGNVEITDMRLGFKIAGRIAELATDEGRTVQQGQRMAALDDAELRSIVAQNQAALKEASDRLDELLAGSRSQEIEQARASLQQAEAELARLQKDYERADILFKNGAIPASQFDAAKSAYLANAARRREASEKLSLVSEGARKEQIAAAEARRQQAQAALAASTDRLCDSVLYAPITGMVLRKTAELGETVAAGTPVFLLGDLSDPWVKVYVKEDKHGRVWPGQKAQISTDSYPDRVYEGTVTFVASEAEFTPKIVQTQEERVKLVYGVKVKVKNPRLELKPGMPADVRILDE